jgi:hypothetical protein
MEQATQTANLFELSCPDTQISYSTSSFAGPPQFSYSGPKGDHSFSGEEIATTDTALGTEVTVTLESVPDLQTITLTVLIPSFRLPEAGETSFETLAIFTTNHTTIAGPPEGPAQSYEAKTLDGTAKSVLF